MKDLDSITDFLETTDRPLSRRAVSVQEQAGDLVSFAGMLNMPDEPVAVERYQGSTDWVVFPAHQDPHLTQGALGAPTRVQRRLKRIAATGTDFDTFLIAHELPPGTLAGARDKGEPLTATLGPPPPDQAARAAVKVAERLTQIGAGVLFAGAAITAAPLALAAGAAAGLAALGLDPVLFGVVAASGELRAGEPVALFYLAHWVNS